MHLKATILEWKRNYQKTRREQVNRANRESNQRVKLMAFLAYGGKCVCCGEHLVEFLTIDHIEGGGRKHLKEIGPHNLHRWLKRHNWPEGFQILCWNCNAAKHFNGGICPHETGGTSFRFLDYPCV